MTERLNRDHEPHMAERVESRIHLAAKQDVARVPRSSLEHCQARAAAAEKELRASDLGSTIGSARSEQCILESLQPRQDVARDVLTMGKALSEAMEENRKLKEECQACKIAHERDVATLETMLEQVMAENKKLKAALELHQDELISQLAAQSKVMEGRVKNMISSAKHRFDSPNSSIPSTSIDTSNDSESATSSDLDKRFTICASKEDAFAGLFGASPSSVPVPNFGRHQGRPS